MDKFAEEYKQRERLVKVLKKMYDLGWAFNQGGCISIRLDEDTFLYNPKHSKDLIGILDLVKLNMDGEQVGGDLEPDSGIFLHIDIYKNRSDIKSVVHAHPPYGTVFSIANMPLDQSIFTDQVLFLGQIPIVEYGSPGTKEIPNNLKKYLPNNNAFLLGNHGAVTVGKDIYEAWDRMECLEITAQVYWMVNSLGGSNPISENNIKKIFKIREDEKYDSHYNACKIIKK